ncbi:hypothetical protein CRENBAI_020595, partial [Crenichthys baileyi]
LEAKPGTEGAFSQRPSPLPARRREVVLSCNMENSRETKPLASHAQSRVERSLI